MNAGQLTPSPACARIAALLPLLDDPQLNGKEAESARDHLAGCAYCQAQQERYRGLDHALRARYGLTSVPPRPTEEIMQHLTDHEGPVMTYPSSSRRAPTPPRVNLSGMAAIAAVLVIVTLTVLLFGARLGLGPGGPTGPARYSFPGTKGSFAAIAMVSPDEGWALGQILTNWDGHSALHEVTFYHYKSGKWTPVTVQTSEDFTLSGVSGFNGSISMDSPTDGWAVASNFNRFTALFRYSNGQWREVQGPALYKIKAVSPSSAWALPGWAFLGSPSGPVGVMHFDGTSWSRQPIDGIENWPNARPLDLNMLSDSEGWALFSRTLDQTEYALAHYNGTTWSVSNIFSTSQGTYFDALAMVSATEGWVLGEQTVAKPNGVTAGAPMLLVLRHYNHGRWTNIPLPMDGGPYFKLDRIVMVSATEGWIAGTEQTARPGTTAANYESHAILFHYLNGQWKQVTLPQTNTAVSEITDLSFSGDGHGWAAGYVSDIPASDTVQDSDIQARGSPLLLSYQDGGWALYHQ